MFGSFILWLKSRFKAHFVPETTEFNRSFETFMVQVRMNRFFKYATQELGWIEVNESVSYSPKKMIIRKGRKIAIIHEDHFPNIFVHDVEKEEMEIIDEDQFVMVSVNSATKIRSL